MRRKTRNEKICDDVLVYIFQGTRYPSWTVFKIPGVKYLVALSVTAKGKLITRLSSPENSSCVSWWFSDLSYFGFNGFFLQSFDS